MGTSKDKMFVRSMKNKLRKKMHSTFNLISGDCSVKDKHLIVHFTHHKCGTAWFNKIFSEMSYVFNLNYQQCTQQELDNDTDIWLEWHSKVSLFDLHSYKGTHMIRDPRDVTISAYFYHLWSDEEWCTIPKSEYDGYCYRDFLNRLPKEEGILFEMKNFLEESNTTGSVILDMSKWDYSNPNMLELKYEDVILNQEKWFTYIFKAYGFDENEIKKSLKIVEKCSFEKRSKRKLGEESLKSHLRKGTPNDWKNHFTENIKSEFKNLHGDILIQLGYEKNSDW